MSTTAFYLIEQQKLFLEAEKIALFTRHAPTIGSYREAILRDYIKKITPSSLKITSGFVSPNKDHKNLKNDQSRQIDVLIYDSDSHVPLLEAGEVSVIRPESLLGCIEIKSRLTFYKKKNPTGSKKKSKEYPLGNSSDIGYRWAGTLIDSIINIKDCAIACEPRKEAYFRGVLSFYSNFELRKFYDALDNGDIQKQLQITHLRQLPTAICVMAKEIALFFDSDIFSQEENHNKFESYYSEMIALKGHEQYPFQFFTIQAYNQIGYSHSRRSADSDGLFSATGSSVRIWSNHFDLACDDM